MASIGIIANPASGKDIRRLVSYATIIDNSEKVNICQRIVLAAQELGIDECVFIVAISLEMTDRMVNVEDRKSELAYSVADNLENDGVMKVRINVLDFEIDASMQDTVTAAGIMEEMGVGCIVVLGGDGTSRAAAKAIKRTPLISVSTGTNNVYPTLMEGTVAGMAAAAVTHMPEPYSCCIHDKRIELRVNGELRDIALIDAVVSSDFFAGARAIWDPSRIERIVVSRCHPATIGFSAIPGAYRIIGDAEPCGFAVTLEQGGEKVLASIAAGVLTEVEISDPKLLMLGEPYGFTAEQRCMIALDGEREVAVAPGDRVVMTVTADGPWRVLPKKALEEAQRLGMYRR